MQVFIILINYNLLICSSKTFCDICVFSAIRVCLATLLISLTLTLADAAVALLNIASKPLFSAGCAVS